MKINVNNAINEICQQITGNISNVLIYGEGVEKITDQDGANYVSTSNYEPCAINDGYDMVIFFVRTTADPNDQVRGGRKNKLTRNVKFKLVANARNVSSEYALSVLLNQTKGVTYTGSDFDNKAIATTYFGLAEHNFETAFFSLDFECVETIVCLDC